MGARVLLHVGLQKSGTTYLQHALSERTHELLAAGVRYPGSGRRTVVPNHQLPFYGLLPESFPWVGPDVVTRGRTRWRQLRRDLDHARARHEAVLLSAEILSYLGPDDVRRVVAELDDGTGDVRVLVTARSLDRLITSAWQQTVRSGDGASLDTFLRARAANRDELYAAHDQDSAFTPWRAFGLGALVARWSDVVGTSAVTVVVNSGRPPELLWYRFLEALDLPADGTIEPVDIPEDRKNVGLQWAETEVLASVNRQLTEAGVDPLRATRIREAVVHGGFLARPGLGTALGLPSDWQAKVQDWSADELSTLARLGTRVIGDVADLRPRPAQSAADQPPSAQSYQDAAERALVAVAASDHFAVAGNGSRAGGVRRALSHVHLPGSR